MAGILEPHSANSYFVRLSRRRLQNALTIVELTALFIPLVTMSFGQRLEALSRPGFSYTMNP